MVTGYVLFEVRPGFLNITYLLDELLLQRVEVDFICLEM
jgi:hypothetical protein